MGSGFCCVRVRLNSALKREGEIKEKKEVEVMYSWEAVSIVSYTIDCIYGGNVYIIVQWCDPGDPQIEPLTARPTNSSRLIKILGVAFLPY